MKELTQLDLTVFYDAVTERMIRYAKVETTSDPLKGSYPTSEKQYELAKILYDELGKIGVHARHLDDKNYIVYAWIPSNTERNSESLGLIAHMDTAPDASGKNVKPWVLKGYGGRDIVLNKEKDIVMKASEYPVLNRYLGQDLILTDGTTLLGGDDKASIASIMTLAEYLVNNPDIPHGQISIAFTPDEEVGGLARDLDIDFFGSDTAYTLDGDHLGYYFDETFNASEAVIRIKGRSVHTGTAKGIMINAVDIASDLMKSLPEKEKPQYTEGTDGFFHLISCNASCEEAEIRLIIRDFDRGRFNARKELIGTIVHDLRTKYGDFIEYEIIPQYSNMKEVVSQYPYLTERLKNAIEDAGVTPVSEPFRGGTDGSALSFRGLPCPNLSAGYENAHGRFEFVSIQSMVKNIEILLHLIDRFVH